VSSWSRWASSAAPRPCGGAGRVAWQLAVRRLQLDPGGPARAVSGITVAVAGAIALQMVFAGIQDEFRHETGADASRAQLVATLQGGDADRVARTLAAAPGARSATALTIYELPRTTLYVAPCAALRELVAVDRCAGGDAFVSGRPAPAWAIGARSVASRPDPTGAEREGVFATPAAVRGVTLPAPEVLAFVRTAPADADAVETFRNAAAAVDPLVQVQPVRRIRTDAQFAQVRRLMFIGASIVVGLIGLSLLLTGLEQLHERRRVLAILTAVGTRRSTLSWSVLWQSAVPVAFGIAIALVTGLGLGALLLRILGADVQVAWADVLGMTAVGALVVLAVTAASLPVLWRTTRPAGLRTE
jgi:hypothetical protein